ncbi:MAG TPA: hypothetical protein VD788_12250 [Candidatus Polarisedimenticolaceae bacterium]|nr:hypothetical protein [Candidatus Polarisedimenticolaceae bacterium]
MSAGAAKQGSRRQFSLGWALGVSVVVHLLLFAGAGWLPLVPVRASSEPEETLLQFSFSEPVETAERSVPEGDVPFETAEPRPRPNTELTPPVDPGATPVPPRPADADAQVEPGPETVLTDAERERQTAEDSSEVQAPALPRDDSEPLFPEDDRPLAEPDSTVADERSRSFDLDRAIRDFGRVLDEARAENPVDPGSSPPRNVFVPDPAELDTTGYGLGNLTFETADFDWSDYARAVYVQIWRAWHNRLLRMTNEFEKWAHQNQDPTLRHANQIRFVIERSGQVSEILIEGPSGCVPLDDSATQALSEVILPPLPDAFPKEREVVHARFIAIGDIRMMKPVLTRMKALNYF